MDNKAFKMHRFANYILYVATACLLVAIFMRGSGMVFNVFLGMGIILGIISVIINAKYWKCPYCGGHLTMRLSEKKLNLCPFCDKPLR